MCPALFLALIPHQSQSPDQTQSPTGSLINFVIQHSQIQILKEYWSKKSSCKKLGSSFWSVACGWDGGQAILSWAFDELRRHDDSPQWVLNWHHCNPLCSQGFQPLVRSMHPGLSLFSFILARSRRQLMRFERVQQDISEGLSSCTLLVFWPVYKWTTRDSLLYG